MAQPNSTDSLAETAYRRIEDMIVRRELSPGAMISENQLADELGCGRTPIREALQRLRLEGFVEIHPRRGVLVSPIDVRRQLELLEVRRALDTRVATLAAARATDAERAEMRRLAAEIQDAARQRDTIRYLAANRAIHGIKAAATRNSVIETMLAAVNGLSRRFWYSYVEDTDAFREAADRHAAVLIAIADRDGEAAVAAAEALLDFLERLTREAIEPKG
ncbi:MAG: GntR family transcriptional regulator [Rhodoplanes sp.]|uniref:GntR family transcriptional regulator n=1 Tax=Rhodoplanes sp. TaxID=1968906 RepID=UPI0018098642|nr:GntR family transcriptional regulator [Rhodoplanes sp.]NVO15514.1 GntR family transcriptional regulator [Rhodoplanes sp.]